VYNANIEVIDVSESEEPKKVGKGKNKVITVTYKSDEGKIEAKKLFDWATKTEVWEAIKTSQKGSVLNVEKEKNDKGYWDWMAVHRQDGPMKTSEGSPARPAPTKPTYETPDERALKQVMIVRQSSISSAVNLLGPVPKGADQVAASALVVEIAKRFESYVMGNSIYDLENDIPS
jgi:hypothetical protein